MRYGQVRIEKHGITGSVCDSNWSVNDALVACRAYGFTAGIPLCCGAFKWLSYPDPVWIRDPECTGNETSLLECPSAETWGQNNGYEHCRHTESDVSVFCYDSDGAGTIVVYL